MTEKKRQSAKGEREYRINVFLCEDDRIAVNSPDIRGLVLECASLGEAMAELLRVGEHLLKVNHGLTNEDIKEVILAVRVGARENVRAPRAHQGARLNFPHLAVA